MQHPLYGVRRLALHLGWSENKTRRIRRLSGVRVQRPRNKYRGYGGKAEIGAPNNHLHTYALFKNTARPQDGMDYSPMTQEADAWVQDFTYLRIRSGMFYLALVMDLATREILSWKLGTNHSSSLTHIALIQALRTNPRPSILHSDRGSEYLSERHAATCQRFGIVLSASRPGSPWQNGFMERCIKSVKEELGPLANYQDIDELYGGVTNAIAYYNNDRIHTTLKMTPRAYAKTLGRYRKRPRRVFGKVVA
jgi:transposase InsO family protein